jgi:lipoprotein-anchoring transpeptidase ErfK/SrfK
MMTTRSSLLMTRRAALLAAVGGLAAGCSFRGVPDPSFSARDAQYMSLVPHHETEKQFLRWEVDYRTHHEPGTVVVYTRDRLLYLVQGNGKAIRYGVGVGDEAFGWSGEAVIARKAEWPRWTPPAEMLARWPHLRSRAGGMAGGPENPLGARALYLYQNGRDTLYRIHGTNEPESIGRASSSGCIRMRNIDAIDLFNRVKVGAKVVVI